MPTHRPRIQVTLDDETSNLLSSLAVQKSSSVSCVAADLIKEALELHEDMSLSVLADQRFKTATGWVDHNKAWE